MQLRIQYSSAYSTGENRIKDLGATLAIDDFGTLGTDPDDLSIVRAIIAISRSLKLNVIAEGVGTEAQLALLRSEGCDEHQGYLFWMPKACRTFWSVTIYSAEKLSAM